MKQQQAGDEAKKKKISTTQPKKNVCEVTAFVEIKLVWVSGTFW